MFKLMKFAKPYMWMLLLAIALLFAQANFDLALPDYLSRIVNNGIQQAGVENAVPQAIRQSEINKLVLFMSAAHAWMAARHRQRCLDLAGRTRVLRLERPRALEDLSDLVDRLRSLTEKGELSEQPTEHSA